MLLCWWRQRERAGAGAQRREREAQAELVFPAGALTSCRLPPSRLRTVSCGDGAVHCDAVETVVMRQPACSALPALTRTHAAAGGAARLPGHRT